MAVRYRIGVLEDEPVTRILLSRTLREEFDVFFADSGASLCQALTADRLDLLLLDILLPKEDGIAIAGAIRARSSVPIILVSGMSSAETMVAGLNVGADDYVTKPFHAEVLRARIRSVLRRTRDGGAPGEGESGRIRIGNVAIDIWSRTSVMSDGRVCRFTEKELQLLSALLSQAGQVVDRNTLSRLLFGQDWSPGNRGLDVHISHLRKKLAELCGRDDIIVSYRGTGYAVKKGLPEG
jgi:DNA-binding response OmpR family regulator